MGVAGFVDIRTYIDYAIYTNNFCGHYSLIVIAIAILMLDLALTIKQISLNS